MSEELGAAGLRFEREGAVAWCVIDRPEARNAFTPAMYFGIKRAVGIVNQDPDLAALIITGTGDVFAPGGDLGGRSDPGDEPTPDIGHDILPFLTIRDSRAPVVAAVNGICQAGGLLIAMLADIAVASDRATFRVPELLRGIPDATYAAVLPAHVGLAVARDLLLSARRFDAAEAQRLGVISRLVPHDELRDAALPGRRGDPADAADGAHAREADAQRALRPDRLPDDVLGPGGVARAARGDAGVHGEAGAELGPRGVRLGANGRSRGQPVPPEPVRRSAAAAARRQDQAVTARRQKAVTRSTSARVGWTCRHRQSESRPRVAWAASAASSSGTVLPRAANGSCSSEESGALAKWRPAAGPPPRALAFQSTASVVAAMSSSAWARTPRTQRRTWPSGVGSLASWWPR